MTQLVLEVSSFLTKPLEGLFDFLRSWNAYVKRNREFNQTVKELSQLTDKELNDIGIARGDIRSIAKGDTDMKRSINQNLTGWV
jgi:uncharacterized protein YjiS (DUF1127 family)